MYICKVSPDGIYFHFPNCKECLLAFSRVLCDEEMAIAYNISSTETHEEFITVERKGKVSSDLSMAIQVSEKSKLTADGIKHFIRLKLEPMQFVILSNQ